MPRIPISSLRRRENLRLSPRPQNTKNTSTTLANMNTPHPKKTHFQTIPVNLGEHTFYATHAAEPNLFPHSWFEMSLRRQTLSFSKKAEGRSVMILIQNQTFLANVVSERMRMALETDNSHLWFSTMLRPTLSLNFTQLPFDYHPTWEMPLVSPLSQPTTMEPILFRSFFFLHQVPEGEEYPWNNDGERQTFSIAV
uniref:Uncharacterized protein n=1 Tax=Solanum lycopersicum TaxID=4081 RepID=A0A3Q7FMC6_SOLLC